MTDTDLLTRRKERAAILFEEIITNNRLELADEVFAPNFYWPQFDLRGPDGVREWVRAFRTAFPDMDDRVQEQTAEGDVVVTRVRCVGTQTGPFRGLPPSGNRADFTAIGIDRFEGDHIVERAAYFDLADLMRQLGHTDLHVPEVDRP
ncbi:SnoaL-like polyketide cyclase [Brevibacterium mcbrellneri ATCC 49030]|uniref:SnoaL-like polyketide cyclase n=1 Tax=Brevibacterium mcbrellneri ATCC 49030 TaxID=585530 RepID=D4YPY0_9MICO|nr:ester cyclase [Brevibacterium mcbrellneri]EFG46728.1 SnoaL-like polyketide cyclase [Brevibacterium mcbrellneri ATCC 49030]